MNSATWLLNVAVTLSLAMFWGADRGQAPASSGPAVTDPDLCLQGGGIPWTRLDKKDTLRKNNTQLDEEWQVRVDNGSKNNAVVSVEDAAKKEIHSETVKFGKQTANITVRPGDSLIIADDPIDDKQPARGCAIKR